MELFGVTDLWLFIIAGLLLNITPGVDLLYITNRSIVQGKRAGVVAALGIGTGCIVHVLAATFGLSMILLSSSVAFAVVKYLGAAYLMYLGSTILLGLRHQERSGTQLGRILPRISIFKQAILINVLNPKVALFFMALLPQFVSPTAPHPALSFLFLGFLFNINGTVVNVLFALLTAFMAKRLQGMSFLPRFLKGLTGTLFLAFGVRLALLD